MYAYTLGYKFAKTCIYVNKIYVNIINSKAYKRILFDNK